MKTLNFFLILSFVIGILCACNKLSAEQTKNIDSTEHCYVERMQTLKLKADSALVFCKNKNMNTDFCLLIDMRIHSGKYRFFIWDFKNDSIITKSLCAHGYGQSSTNKTPVFSNVIGSYCTSLGKYKTGISSPSKWGIGIHYKLHGLEPTNSNAYERVVVLHSYAYVPEAEMYPEYLPLGYSQGCPVISNEAMKIANRLLKNTKKSTLLWIYY